MPPVQEPYRVRIRQSQDDEYDVEESRVIRGHAPVPGKSVLIGAFLGCIRVWQRYTVDGVERHSDRDVFLLSFRG